MEKDKSDSIVMYCIIVLVVLIAIGAVIAISFTDFSPDEPINTEIAIENKVEKPKKKTNTVVENEVENIIDTEETIEDTKENTEEVYEEEIIVEEENEEQPTQAELDAKEYLNDAANNPLNQLAKLGGNTVIVSADRITLKQDDPNADIYFQFDENENMTGLFLEFTVEDEEYTSLYVDLFSNLLETDDVTVDGNHITVKYPFDESFQLTKSIAIENLSASFNIEYE